MQTGPRRPLRWWEPACVPCSPMLTPSSKPVGKSVAEGRVVSGGVGRAEPPLFDVQSAVGAAGCVAAGAPHRGGTVHPTFHQKQLEEQVLASCPGGGATPAGLFWLRPRHPQHHGLVSEQRHRQVTAAAAGKQQRCGE